MHALWSGLFLWTWLTRRRTNVISSTRVTRWFLTNGTSWFWQNSLVRLNVSVGDPTHHSLSHVLMIQREHKVQCYCRHKPARAFLEHFLFTGYFQGHHPIFWLFFLHNRKSQIFKVSRQLVAKQILRYKCLSVHETVRCIHIETSLSILFSSCHFCTYDHI